MITLECKIREPIGRFDMHDYVRPVVIRVIGEDEDGARYEVGRLYADLVAWAEALDHGESLEDICDDDSEGLLTVYGAIAGPDDEIRQDLCDVLTLAVLFIYNVTLAPRLKEYRQAILFSAANLFGLETMTVSFRGNNGFEEAELANIGFRKIAGSRVIFRHNSLQDEFSKQNPQGVDSLDFEPTPEDEKWLKAELARKGFIRRRKRSKALDDSPQLPKVSQ